MGDFNSSEIPNSSDCISRQAALDVLDAYQVMVENGEENPYAWARARMCELPSTQLDNSISRQAAIEAIRKLPNAGMHWFVSAEAVFDVLLKLPSAQPPNCDGCKHKGKYEFELEFGASCPCINCKRRVNDNYE